MKRASSSSASAQKVSVILQDTLARLPSAMPQTAGLLIYRESDSVLTYWTGAAWITLNSAGWAIQFHCAFPNIPVGNWAIVVGPRLDTVAGALYQGYTATGLMMAMHFVHGATCLPHPEKSEALSDQLAENPEFTDIREDVDAYVQEVMAREGIAPLAK